MELDAMLETGEGPEEPPQKKEKKEKKEQGLMRRIAEKAAKLTAYFAVGAAAVVGGIIVEQLGSPVQKTISGYMLKHEQ